MVLRAHGELTLPFPGLHGAGIIDVLQRWDFWKRLEYFTKVYLLCSNRHGISAVHYDECVPACSACTGRHRRSPLRMCH